MQVIYKATVTSTSGRDGRAVSSDNFLDVKLSTPRELGGAGGEATNPEQLFAAGYSACFLSAIKYVAGQSKIALTADSSVRAEVGIGQIPGGFGLDVELFINLPGIADAVADDLIAKAHQVCPYSNATRNSLKVRLTLV
ncbi:organic hydroperoxide resistance protein [Rheinheimera sp. SA_1]|jgi:Ohr subfamily peroxiredoxin|uniref:organic hydroperoxide resistance protein n=1 Tax=Rheinheimera sp. SA_1 TaxID=1827365 RepID=UPI0007FE15EF|nr:organic hydroperoxide resistance protein [Rheinheimera sp. SA_1]OBP15720.1 organic hydroperoxide resistance protein [Rheinheimera sp. SA_1]